MISGNASELGKKIDQAIKTVSCPDHQGEVIFDEKEPGKFRFFYCGCDKMKNLLQAKLRSIGMDDVMN